MNMQDEDNFMPGLPKDEGDVGEGASFAARLAAGGDDGGYVVASESKSKVSTSTIAFVGLAVLAGGGLWLIKERAGGPTTAAADPSATAARTSIRQFLEGGASEVEEMKSLLSDAQAIQERFSDFNQSKQVPLDALKTNPFWHEEAEVEETIDAEAVRSREQEEKLQQERERLRQQEEARARTDAAALKLETVFLGSRPSCIINGTICRVGSVIDGFTLTTIHQGAVVIKRDDHEFTLTLDPK